MSGRRMLGDPSSPFGAFVPTPISAPIPVRRSRTSSAYPRSRTSSILTQSDFLFNVGIADLSDPELPIKYQSCLRRFADQMGAQPGSIHSGTRRLSAVASVAEEIVKQFGLSEDVAASLPDLLLRLSCEYAEQSVRDWIKFHSLGSRLRGVENASTAGDEYLISDGKVQSILNVLVGTFVQIDPTLEINFEAFLSGKFSFDSGVGVSNPLAGSIDSLTQEYHPPVEPSAPRVKSPLQFEMDGHSSDTSSDDFSDSSSDSGVELVGLDNTDHHNAHAIAWALGEALHQEDLLRVQIILVGLYAPYRERRAGTTSQLSLRDFAADASRVAKKVYEGYLAHQEKVKHAWQEYERYTAASHGPSVMPVVGAYADPASVSFSGAPSPLHVRGQPKGKPASLLLCNESLFPDDLAHRVSSVAIEGHSPAPCVAAPSPARLGPQPKDGAHPSQPRQSSCCPCFSGIFGGNSKVKPLEESLLAKPGD